MVVTRDYIDVGATHQTVSIVAGQTTTSAFLSSEFNTPAGNLRVTNSTSTDTVYYVYARPHSGGDWGYDELYPSSIDYMITPTKTFWNDNLFSGAYDLVAFTPDSLKYAMLNNNVFSSSFYTWTISSFAPTSSITETNNSSYTITEMEIKPASGSSWSYSLLSTNIATYGSKVIPKLPPDKYVVQAYESASGLTAYDTVTITTSGQSIQRTLLTSQFVY
jgi:hypothetical protein